MSPEEVVSSLGYGCARLLREPSAAKRQRLLEIAFDCGVRYFDVARMYGLGTAEGELGKFVQGRRDSVQLATKFGIQVQSLSVAKHLAHTIGRRIVRWFPALRTQVGRATQRLVLPKDFSVQAASRSLRESLRQLRCERIETLLLHEPNGQDAITDDLIDWLRKLKADGVIGTYGISGEPQEMLVAPNLSKHAWPLLQFSNHLLSRFELEANWASVPQIVTFGAISGAVDRFSEMLAVDATLTKEIESRFEAELDDIETAAILLRANLAAFPGSRVLFSTSQTRRLKGIIQRTSTMDWNDDTLPWLQNVLSSPRASDMTSAGLS